VLISDPLTLALTALAVALVGLSKGGLGGAFALMGVPVMALVMPPVQAAAILLPVLLMMDAVGLWTWRGQWDMRVVRLMLPSAILGIGVGWGAASFTSDDAVRLIVGLVALGFVLRMAWTGWRRAAPAGPAVHRPVLAQAAGAVAGFTSFVAHAGGPPYQIYALPLRMEPKVYTATSVLFFAAVNLVKVGPYWALGMFEPQVLGMAAVMLPVAVIFVLLGAAVVRRMRAGIFYPIMYAMIALVSIKLIHDGLRVFG
jgi:uncharacterized protein